MSANGDRPRVLIVSDTPFSEYHGAGVTMTTLFEGWPADRLEMFCSGWSPMTRMPSADQRCARMRPFRVPGPGGRLDWVKYRLGLRPSWQNEVSASWHRRWFRDARPGVVYSLFLDLKTFDYADRIAGILNVPHVCHITDDITPGVEAFGLDRLRRCMQRAARRLAISDEMKRRYETLLDCEFDVFHNGAASAPATAAVRQPLVARYLGSVSVIQHGALQDLAQAVHRARAAGVPWQLEIAGSFWEEGLDASFVDGVAVRRTGSYVSAEDWADLLSSAGLLLIPVTFSTDLPLNVRLSLPTKLLEYFSTGTPVLVYGPADSAPAQFCRRHQVGSVIDVRDVDAVARFLIEFSTDAPRFTEQAAASRDTVRRMFSNEATAARFQQLLIDTAGAR